mmetsp:Transcript_7129/g.31356  ORF Transcript_7129/g.31356 Transcript_7129/m.31356 type:complete len:217 (-) Transcript_7129:1183-1833(-)
MVQRPRGDVRDGDGRRGRQLPRPRQRQAPQEDEGGVLLFPTVAVPVAAHRAHREEPRLHPAHAQAQRDPREAPRGRAQGPVRVQDDVRLGDPGSGRPGSRDVRLVRRADQLPHRHGLADEADGRRHVARVRSHHRQRHHLVPLRDLAVHAVVRGAAAAENRLWSRVCHRRGWAEDVQIDRQRRRSRGAAHQVLVRYVQVLPHAQRRVRQRRAVQRE